MTTNETTRTGYEHLTTKALIKAYDRTNPGMVAEFASRDTTPAQRATVANACAATYDGPLSSAGVIRNGGIKLGGETKPASTGRKSTGKTRAVKMTKIVDVPANATPAANPAKPITRGRIIAEGFYTYNDTVARVKISRSSGKPYALVLDLETGKFEYAPGVVKNLSSDDVVSYEVAAAFGRRTGRCMICGHVLEKTESIDAGIGPICGGRVPHTTDDAPVTNAEIETSTVADNTTFDTTAFNIAVRTVNELIRAANNHPVDPADVTKWVDLRDVVMAGNDDMDIRADRMRDIVTALTKWVANLDAMETRRNADDAAVAALAGPVWTGSRWDHTACTHPRTTAGRTACRKAHDA